MGSLLLLSAVVLVLGVVWVGRWLSARLRAVFEVLDRIECMVDVDAPAGCRDPVPAPDAAFFVDMLAERDRQREKGRGDAFDDARTAAEWLSCLHRLHDALSLVESPEAWRAGCDDFLPDGRRRPWPIGCVQAHGGDEPCGPSCALACATDKKIEAGMVDPAVREPEAGQVPGDRVPPGSFCPFGCSPLKIGGNMCDHYRPDGSPRPWPVGCVTAHDDDAEPCGPDCYLAAVDEVLEAFGDEPAAPPSSARRRARNAQLPPAPRGGAA